MISWQAFTQQAPRFAEAGARLFDHGGNGISIGFLATVTATAKPRLAPVCPIFFEQGIYLSVGAPTPKRADLKERGDYVLHTFLGTNDEEFQIAGR
ncbi:MAG: pyridoxamine 5'-phosphate oxidase, partial [Gammaproteobacteria bacterium]